MNDDNEGQMLFGDLGDLKLPDTCLTYEEKPPKNLTQETFPDQGSNPGPLRDKLAYYHLFNSGGLSNKTIRFFKIFSRAICRVTLLKLELSAILKLYGPLQKNVYNKKTLCSYTL